LAGLLAFTHERSAYQQVCRNDLATFGNTTAPYIAERTAQDCLLLPDSGVDLRQVDKLATLAVTFGNNDSAMGYYQACKALSNYRFGRFAAAIESGEKSLNYPVAYAQAKAYGTLAMAHWRLGQTDAARASLAAGDALAPPVATANSAVDLGETWVSWLFARVTLDEAATLIQTGPAASPRLAVP
jgi:hypothetical protein